MSNTLMPYPMAVLPPPNYGFSAGLKQRAITPLGNGLCLLQYGDESMIKTMVVVMTVDPTVMNYAWGRLEAEWNYAKEDQYLRSTMTEEKVKHSQIVKLGKLKKLRSTFEVPALYLACAHLELNRKRRTQYV